MTSKISSEEQQKKYEKVFSEFLIERIKHAGGSLQFQFLSAFLQQLEYEVRNVFGINKSELMKFLRKHPDIFEVNSKGIVTVVGCISKDYDYNITFEENDSSSKKTLIPKIRYGIGKVFKISPEFAIIKAEKPFLSFVFWGANENKLFIDEDSDLEVGTLVYFNAIHGHSDYEIEYRATQVWPMGDSYCENYISENTEKEKKIKRKFSGKGTIQKLYSKCGVISVEGQENKVFFSSTSVKDLDGNFAHFLKVGANVQFTAELDFKNQWQAIEVIKIVKERNNLQSAQSETSHKPPEKLNTTLLENLDGKIYPCHTGASIKFGNKYSESATADSLCHFFLYGTQVHEIMFEFSEGDYVKFDAVKINNPPGCKALLVWVGVKPTHICSRNIFENYNKEKLKVEDGNKKIVNALSETSTLPLSSNVCKSQAYVPSKQRIMQKKNNNIMETKNVEPKIERMDKEDEIKRNYEEREIERNSKKHEIKMYNKGHEIKRNDKEQEIKSNNQRHVIQRNNEEHIKERKKKERMKERESKFLVQSHIDSSKNNFDAPKAVRRKSYRKKSKPHNKNNCEKIKGTKSISHFVDEKLISEVHENDGTVDKYYDCFTSFQKGISDDCTSENREGSSEENSAFSNLKDNRKKFLKEDKSENSVRTVKFISPDPSHFKTNYVKNSRELLAESSVNKVASKKKHEDIEGEIIQLFCQYAIIKSSYLENDVDLFLNAFYLNGRSMEEQQVIDFREVIKPGDVIKFNCFEIIDDSENTYYRVTMAWKGAKPEAYEIKLEEFIDELQLDSVCNDLSDSESEFEEKNSFNLSCSDFDETSEFHSESEASLNNAFSDTSYAMRKKNEELRNDADLSPEIGEQELSNSFFKKLNHSEKKYETRKLNLEFSFKNAIKQESKREFCVKENLSSEKITKKIIQKIESYDLTSFDPETGKKIAHEIINLVRNSCEELETSAVLQEDITDDIPKICLSCARKSKPYARQESIKHALVQTIVTGEIAATSRK